MLTYDTNSGGIDWDKNGRRIVFTSSFEGTQNIYYINLMNLKYSEATKGFYTADYINEFVDKKQIYIRVTAGKDTVYSDPKWSPKDGKILSIGTYKNENEIFYTNRITSKTIGTGIKNVVATNWKNNQEIYTVYKEKNNQLYSTSLAQKTDSLLLTAPSDILGISKQKGVLYIACNGGVLEYKTETKKTEWYKMNISGKTAWKLNRLNFIAKHTSGDAQIIDLNNGVTESLFMGEQDGDPALSRDKKFVGFYSDFLKGIVIKKLIKKY